jgi:hypothetical protein
LAMVTTLERARQVWAWKAPLGMKAAKTNTQGHQGRVHTSGFVSGGSVKAE